MIEADVKGQLSEKGHGLCALDLQYLNQRIHVYSALCKNSYSWIMDPEEKSNVSTRIRSENEEYATFKNYWMFT